jgi:hypothetical protein
MRVGENDTTTINNETGTGSVFYGGVSSEGASNVDYGMAGVE